MKKILQKSVLLVFLICSINSVFGQTSNYFNGFETTVGSGNWLGVTIRPSGYNGIPSSAGGFYADASTNFTQFGGYNYIFPTWGYKTSVDIYLNMSGGYLNDKRFDYTSAISSLTGHRRDFVFNGGFYNDAGTYGTGDRFVFSASNNSAGWPRDPGRSPIVINTTGWYKLEHYFRNNGGILAVDLTIYNSANVIMGSWTLSDITDIIGTTVGGNRYGWFATNQLGTLAIDNSALYVVPPPPVRVYSDATETILLSSHSTIQAGINAAVNGNAIRVDAGTYTVPANTTILVDKPLTLKGANYGVCGTGSRGAESKIVVNHSSGFAMTIRSGGVTVDGFEFETQLGRDAINVNTPYVASALSTMSNFNFSNNIFRSSTTSANKNGIVFGENNLNANQLLRVPIVVL
jgi:hypothetical protein